MRRRGPDTQPACAHRSPGGWSARLSPASAPRKCPKALLRSLRTPGTFSQTSVAGERRSWWRIWSMALASSCDVKSLVSLLHRFGVMKPDVPSSVAYRCMRGWQRLRVKPPRQCRSAKARWRPRGRNRICERQRGWIARLVGMVNVCEVLINTVKMKEPKTLTGSTQNGA